MKAFKNFMDAFINNLSENDTVNQPSVQPNINTNTAELNTSEALDRDNKGDS